MKFAYLFLTVLFVAVNSALGLTKPSRPDMSNTVMEHSGAKPNDSIQDFLSNIMNNKIALPDILSGKVQLPGEFGEIGKEVGIHVLSILLANVAVNMMTPEQPNPMQFMG